MQRIPLSGAKGAGLFLLVDDEDYEMMSRYKWTAHKRGNRLQITASVTPHSLLVDYKLTDHKNGDPLDNRRENLREATQAQNTWNRPPSSRSKTGFKGVFRKTRDKKYICRIMVNGELHHLGMFTDPEEAARVYDEAARRLHGEFAWLNFPDEGGGDLFRKSCGTVQLRGLLRVI